MMIILNVNLLIFAHNRDAPHHQAAKEWLPEFFFDGLEKLGTAGNLTTDAHLAALSIEYQAELHSCDTDFHRFPGLRWRNPLLP